VISALGADILHLAESPETFHPTNNIITLGTVPILQLHFVPSVNLGQSPSGIFTLTPPLSRPGRGKKLVDETKKPIPFLEMGLNFLQTISHPMNG
jgi:hypothetical protein